MSPGLPATSAAYDRMTSSVDGPSLGSTDPVPVEHGILNDDAVDRVRAGVCQQRPDVSRRIEALGLALLHPRVADEDPPGLAVRERLLDAGHEQAWRSGS